jgi:hypothetical protein
MGGMIETEEARNTSLCRYVNEESQMNRPESIRGDRPTTNHLNHGTAQVKTRVVDY